MKNTWYNSFKYIRRKIETRLLQNLDRDETMVLVGPRQSGKTTLLKHLKKILEKFSLSGYKQFIKSYPEIPIRAASFINPKPDHLTFFDLV